MYHAIDLSKYIVTKCVSDGYPISNLQLQKILYYIQKAFLQNGSQAFADDIEAWQFGPVVPNVYYYFCGYGAMPITASYQTNLVMDFGLNVVDQIVEAKRTLDPWVMVSETHKPEGAWSKIYQNGLGNHNIIPIELIKKVG